MERCPGLERRKCAPTQALSSIECVKKEVHPPVHRQMPSNKLYESETFAKDSDQEYAPAANSALLPRRRPMHGKWTAMILGGSVCLNAMLVLYCANMQFMKPLAYDRGQELAYLQMKDRELTAQKLSLERTTQGLMEQKAQLLQHYKETETVGKKLETYKEKLRVDAQVEDQAPSPHFHFNLYINIHRIHRTYNMDLGC